VLISYLLYKDTWFISSDLFVSNTKFREQGSIKNIYGYYGKAGRFEAAMAVLMVIKVF